MEKREEINAKITDVNKAIRENESQANHSEIGEEVTFVPKQFIKLQCKSNRPRDYGHIDDAVVPIGENEGGKNHGQYAAIAHKTSN